MVVFNAEVPQYLPVILERYKKFKAGKFSFQNLKFSEYLDDADHDSGAFDVYFICSDGIVPAHRLVIANVSKYIMSMFDDQPPWYLTKIHIPDLSSDILEILVDLAYSGEMKFPPDQQNDIIDAMQALGWIHTDCLSAEYIDGEVVDSSADLNELKDEKAERVREEETLGETGLSFVFPTSSATSGSQVSPKRKAFFGKEPETTKSGVPGSGRNSFTEGDDDSMEISRLPDFDVSDSEDALVSGTNKQKFDGQGGSGTETGTNFGNLSKAFKSESVGKITPPRTPERRSSRASASGSTQKSNQNQTEERTSQDAKQAKKGGSKASTPCKPASANKTPIKRGAPDNSAPIKRTKKLAEDESEVTEVALSPVVEESSAGSSSDSPSKRQRRKPKRFEEFEEIPTESNRSKTSPTKNSNRGKKSSTSSIKSLDNDKDQDLGSVDIKVKPGKTKPQTTPSKKNKESDLKTEYSTESSNGKEADETSNSSKPILKSSSRGRKSRASAEKNSLITSFFSKKDEKSDDLNEKDSEQEELAVLDKSSSDDAVIMEEQTSETLTKSTSVKKSGKVVPAKTKITGQPQETATPVKKRGSRRESNVSTSTNGSSRASVSSRPKSKRSKIEEDEGEKSGAMNISSDDDFIEVKVTKQDKKSSKKLVKPDTEASVETEKDPSPNPAKTESPRASRKSTRGTKRQIEDADDSKIEGRMRSKKSTKDEPESTSTENTEIGSSSSRRSSKAT